MELKALDRVLPYIFGRKWCLFRAPVTASFVTSDHPACLMWSDPPKEKGPVPPPGLGLHKTHLLFPVSAALAIAGAFETEKEDVVEANEEQVARINGAISARSRHQIYAVDEAFPYILPGHGQIRRGSQLLDDLPPATDTDGDED